MSWDMRQMSVKGHTEAIVEMLRRMDMLKDPRHDGGIVAEATLRKFVSELHRRYLE